MPGDVTSRQTTRKQSRGLCRIKMLPVVGHVHGLRETLRVRAATANVALRNITYKEKSLIIPLYKAIVRPHLE